MKSQQKKQEIKMLMMSKITKLEGEKKYYVNFFYVHHAKNTVNFFLRTSCKMLMSKLNQYIKNQPPI